MNNASDIIGHWPDLVTFACDVGVSEHCAKKWVSRNSIPGPHWLTIVNKAKARGIQSVTLDALARIAAAKSEVA